MTADQTFAEGELARRLLDIAGRRPTYIWLELQALALELEQGSRVEPEPEQANEPADDMEALVRATQPPARPSSLLGTLLRRRR